MSNKRLGLGFNPKHYTDDNITQTVMKALWVPGPVATITNAAADKAHVDKIGPESNDEVVSKTIAEARSDSAAGANRFAVVGLGGGGGGTWRHTFCRQRRVQNAH